MVLLHLVWRVLEAVLEDWEVVAAPMEVGLVLEAQVRMVVELEVVPMAVVHRLPSVVAQDTAAAAEILTL